MNEELFALLTLDAGDVSLATLGRAIVAARRHDRVHVHRVFLGPRVEPEDPGTTTQRIRVRIGPRA